MERGARPPRVPFEAARVEPLGSGVNTKEFKFERLSAGGVRGARHNTRGACAPQIHLRFLPSIFSIFILSLGLLLFQHMSSDMHDDADHLTTLGWTMFALYLIAALLSFRAAVSVRNQSSAVGRQQSSETSRIWIWLAVLLAALGLNKPLDLQTRLIELGRHLARQANLPPNLPGLHVLFFLGFLLAIMALFAVVMIRLPAQIAKFGRQLPLAAGGSSLVCLYIVIRAASIDSVDQMLGFDLEHIPFLWLLEAGGLMLIAVQALLNFHRQR